MKQNKKRRGVHMCMSKHLDVHNFLSACERTCVNMLNWFYANLKDKRMSARAAGIGWMCLSKVRMGTAIGYSNSSRPAGYIQPSGRGEWRLGLFVSGVPSSDLRVTLSSERSEQPAVDVM